jgi:hypothetical protein
MSLSFTGTFKDEGLSGVAITTKKPDIVAAEQRRGFDGFMGS